MPYSTRRTTKTAANAAPKMSLARAMDKLRGTLQVAQNEELAVLLSQTNAAELALGLLQDALASRGIDTDAKWVGFDESAMRFGPTRAVSSLLEQGLIESERAFLAKHNNGEG